MINQLQFPDQLPIDLYHKYFGTGTWKDASITDNNFNELNKLPHLDSNYRYLNVGDLVMVGKSVGRIISLGYRSKNYARPYAEIEVMVYDTRDGGVNDGWTMIGYESRINVNKWNCQYSGDLRRKDPRYDCEVTKLDGLI